MNLRYVVVGDNHGGEQNDEVVERFFLWISDYRPDIVIHAGDNWNFGCLRKKATDKEKEQMIAPDFEAGVDFFKRLFHFGKHRHYLRGNHCERVWETARDSTNAAIVHAANRLANDITSLCGKLKVRMLPYDSRLGVLETQGIRVIHGYVVGAYAARRLASIYGTCCYGHTHSMDVGTYEHWPEPYVAYGTGCLLKIDQDYNSKAIAKLRHSHGWIYGETDGIKATYQQWRV